MASFPRYSIIKPHYSEEEWSIHVHQLFTGQSKEVDSPISICRVADSLTVKNPEAYFPDSIALGPYNHFLHCLYHMYDYKVSEAAQAHQMFQLPEFRKLADDLKKHVKAIRSYYQDTFDFSDETFSLMFVIDGLFLLRVMKDMDRYFSTNSTSQDSDSTNRAGKLFNLNPEGDILDLKVLKRERILEATIHDIVLLENQIPFVVIKELKSRINPAVSDLPFLEETMIELCTRLSPIELPGDWTKVRDGRHLLDYIHKLVWFGKMEKSEIPTTRMGGGAGGHGNPETHNPSEDQKKIFNKISSKCKGLGFAGNVAGQIIDFIIYFLDTLGISLPTVRDLRPGQLIPTATELSSAGVKFCRLTYGGIGRLEFSNPSELSKGSNWPLASSDQSKGWHLPSAHIHLPVVQYGLNHPPAGFEGSGQLPPTFQLPAFKEPAFYTQVLARNLLAYESTTMTPSRNFTCYIQIMSSLIDTPNDVDLLKKDEIKIIPKEASSEGIVELFEALRGTIAAEPVVGKSKLDEEVKKINEYYKESNKSRKRLIRYFTLSLKALTILATILLLALMALQTFCSIYSCPRILKTTNSS